MYTVPTALLLLTVSILGVSLTPSVDSPVPEQAGVIVLRAYVFYSPGCSTCKLVQRPALTSLAEDMGCQIELKYFDVNDMDNYDFLTRVERALKDENNKIPAWP